MLMHVIKCVNMMRNYIKDIIMCKPLKWIVISSSELILMLLM